MNECSGFWDAFITSFGLIIFLWRTLKLLCDLFYEVQVRGYKKHRQQTCNPFSKIWQFLAKCIVLLGCYFMSAYLKKDFESLPWILTLCPPPIAFIPMFPNKNRLWSFFASIVIIAATLIFDVEITDDVKISVVEVKMDCYALLLILRLVKNLFFWEIVFRIGDLKLHVVYSRKKMLCRFFQWVECNSCLFWFSVVLSSSSDYS